MNENETVMECKNLSKTFGGTAALKGVNLKISRGRIVGLLGPNGSGKTTLIKIANGLLVPTSGEIIIEGGKVGERSKRLVSYLPDCMSLPNWMKVSELMDFYAGFYNDFNREKAETMLLNLGLDGNKRFKELSKGNKEKVQLILTMSREAKLYLLDEPLGGVDPATRDYILNTIISNYSEDASVVISTHLIADVEKILDEIFFIKDGQIILSDMVDNIRSVRGMSVDALFREEFKC